MPAEPPRLFTKNETVRSVMSTRMSNNSCPTLLAEDLCMAGAEAFKIPTVGAKANSRRCCNRCMLLFLKLISQHIPIDLKVLELNSAQLFRYLGPAIVSSVLHSTGGLEKEEMIYYGKPGHGTVKVYM